MSRSTSFRFLQASRSYARGCFAVALGWDDRGVVEVEGQPACLVSFLGPIRDQEPAFGLGTDPCDESP